MEFQLEESGMIRNIFELNLCLILLGNCKSCGVYFEEFFFGKPTKCNFNPFT